MIKNFVMATQPLDLVIAGLVLFALVFVLLVAWTFRRGNRALYESAANLPLDLNEISEKGVARGRSN